MSMRRFRFIDGWWHYGWRIWLDNLFLLVIAGIATLVSWKRRDTNG